MAKETEGTEHLHFSMELIGNWQPTDWIPVAKVGQYAPLGDGKLRALTKQALQGSVDTWNSGVITKNHVELVKGLQIKAAKFEDPFLYMQFDDETLKYITDPKSSGRSIEFTATDYNDTEVFAGVGKGISVLFEPHRPACNKTMGCFSVKSEPYGNVEYADPGYQEDKVKRYPIDTEEHVRAALSYINVAKNAEKYTAEQLSQIKSRIESAAKKYGIEIKYQADEHHALEDLKDSLTFMKEHPDMVDAEMKAMMTDMMATQNKKETTMADYTPEEITKMLDWMKINPNMVSEEHKAKMADMMGKTGGDKAGGSPPSAAAAAQAQETKMEAKFAAENEVLKAKIAAFEKTEAENAKTAMEAKFQAIVDTGKIPAGKIHKPEDRAALKMMFETKPQDFAVMLAGFKTLTGTEQQGMEFSQQEGDTDAKGEGAQVGNYNPVTKTYEVK